MSYNHAAASESLNPFSVEDGWFRRSPWTLPVLLVVVVIPMFAVFIPAIPFSLFIFSALLYAGWMYTTYVLITLIKSWRKSPDEPKSEISEVVKSFGLFRQKTALILNSMLTLSVIALPFAASHDLLLYFVGSLIGTYAITLIAVNSEWIFNKEIRASEWAAIKTRTGKWKLIAFNLFFSAIVWIIGSLALPIYSLAGWSFL